MKSLLIILIALLAAGVPFSVGAQGSGDFTGTYGGWALIVPYLRVGWQRMGINFSLDVPIVVSGDASLRQSPVELQIKETKLLMGEIGFDVRSGSRLSFFGRAAGDARHHATAVTSIVPANTSFLSPTTWGSPNLEWWRIEGGGGVAFWGTWALLGGMRWDHLQLRLENPTNGANEGALDAGTVYSADFRAKIRLPYLGLQLVGSRSRATVLYSPWARTDFKLPFRLTAGRGAPGNTAGEEGKYSLSSGGYFLEGSFEYDLRMRGRMVLGVWATGSLMRFTGQGDFDLLQQQREDTPMVVTSVSGESTYSRHTLTVGLSAKYPF